MFLVFVNSGLVGVWSNSFIYLDSQKYFTPKKIYDNLSSSKKVSCLFTSKKICCSEIRIVLSKNSLKVWHKKMHPKKDDSKTRKLENINVCIVTGKLNYEQKFTKFEIFFILLNTVQCRFRFITRKTFSQLFRLNKHLITWDLQNIIF